MDNKLKQKWIEALRSGKYKQGKGFLRDLDNNYCCLGVLCDIVKDDLKEDWVKDIKTLSYEFVKNNKVLPPLDIFSEMSRNGYIVNHKTGKDYSLARLNDTRKSFKQIANIIEKNL